MTVTDEIMLDAWWQAIPRRPSTEVLVPFGAMTVTRECRACGKRSSIAVTWSGVLCGVCRGDLEKTERKLKAVLVEASAALDVAMETWVERQAALDDELASRWYRLCGDRQKAQAQLQRAQTDKYYGWDNEKIAAHIEQRQAAFSEIMGKIERTMMKGGPLAELLSEEAAHNTALKRIEAIRCAAEIGLQEVSAARDEVPF